MQGLIGHCLHEVGQYYNCYTFTSNLLFFGQINYFLLGCRYISAAVTSQHTCSFLGLLMRKHFSVIFIICIRFHAYSPPQVFCFQFGRLVPFFYHGQLTSHFLPSVPVQCFQNFYQTTLALLPTFYSSQPQSCAKCTYLFHTLRFLHYFKFIPKLPRVGCVPNFQNFCLVPFQVDLFCGCCVSLWLSEHSRHRKTHFRVCTCISQGSLEQQRLQNDSLYREEDLLE